MSSIAKNSSGSPEDTPQFVGRQESVAKRTVSDATQGFSGNLKNIFAHLGTDRPKVAPQKIDLNASIAALQPLEISGFRISFDEKEMRRDAAIIGARSVMPIMTIDDTEDLEQSIAVQVAGIEDTILLRETLAEMAQDPDKAAALEQLFSDFMPGNFNKIARPGGYTKEVLLQIIEEAKRRKGAK